MSTSTKTLKAAGESQRLAFEYLCEQARTAHSEGDGLRVNSLCAVALSEARRLAREKMLKVSLVELRWAFAFSMYWLIDGFMLREAKALLEAAVLRDKRDEALKRFLAAYLDLLVVSRTDFRRDICALETSSLRWIGAFPALEDLVLLSHCAELTWWYSTSGRGWLGMLATWSKKVPKSAKPSLESIRRRLTWQARLTTPSTAFPTVKPKDLKALGGVNRFASLWFHGLTLDQVLLDDEIKRSVLGRPEDLVQQKLLFDFHHINCLRGAPGDSQIIGLSRRRLVCAKSPLLLFNYTRHSRMHSGLGSLIYDNTPQNEEARHDVFRLAVIAELAALRIWDFQDWREAQRCQARTFAEALRWQPDNEVAAANHVNLSVRTISFDAKNGLTRTAIEALEFASKKTLHFLMSSLLRAYPIQKLEVNEVLTSLGDAIPTGNWLHVAKWCAKYGEEQRAHRYWGGSLDWLGFWRNLIPEVPGKSQIWAVLQPLITYNARNPFQWRSERGALLYVYLVHAPLTYAVKIWKVLVAGKEQPGPEELGRQNILHFAAKERPALLKSGKPPAGAKSEACDPFEELEQQSGDVPTRLELAAKKELARRLNALAKGTGELESEDHASRSFIPGDCVAKLEWSSRDHAILDALITCMEHPTVRKTWGYPLMNVAVVLAERGPETFVRTLHSAWTRWVEERSEPSQEPQSELPFHSSRTAEETGKSELGVLGFVLLERLGDNESLQFYVWLAGYLLAPTPSSVPNVIYMLLPSAVKAQHVGRSKMLSSIQSLLIFQLREYEKNRSNVEFLAQSILYLAAHLKSNATPRVNWDEPEAQKALKVFAQMMSPIFARLGKCPNPEVRQHLATLLRALRSRALLPEALISVLGQLAKDNRARVRRAAKAGFAFGVTGKKGKK
jgi:hypothetical protein